MKNGKIIKLISCFAVFTLSSLIMTLSVFAADMTVITEKEALNVEVAIMEDSTINASYKIANAYRIYPLENLMITSYQSNPDFSELIDFNEPKIVLQALISTLSRRAL